MVGDWWLLVGGWWLLAVAWWLVVGGWFDAVFVYFPQNGYYSSNISINFLGEKVVKKWEKSGKIRKRKNMKKN